MIILQVNKLTKSYYEIDIFKDITFAINEKERVGLIGPNGAGKSTLLKCILGHVKPDSGEVMLANNRTYAYLEQLHEKYLDKTAWDLVMDSFSHLIELRNKIRTLETEIANANEDDLTKLLNRYSRFTDEYEALDGYSCESIARGILIGLGFSVEEFSQLYRDFSGGQKTRISLAKLLAAKPDVLILDEPTNHLDIKSVLWLEDFLSNYTGSILMVSHDRTFLDNVCNRILELNNTKIKSYPGNYSKYLNVKALEDLTFERAYKKQQEKIRRTEEFIRKYKAGVKSKQARGRELQLERMNKLELESRARMSSWEFNSIDESAHIVLLVSELKKSYENKLIFQDINLEITKGQKIALIGPNGCGKTTLLKAIVDKIDPDSGQVQLGSRVKMAYFSQEYENLNLHKTLLDELLSSFNITIQEARSYLGRMMFSGDDVYKTVSQLSGGERGRLSFLKILITGANFLVLDEPTNHLDIESCQLVEDLLVDYPGTILFVSHDRFFIDQIADGVISMDNKVITYYHGNYSYYKEKISSIDENASEASKIKELNKKQKPRDQKKEKEKLIQKLTEQLSSIEEEINQIEKEKTEIEEVLSNGEIYNDENKVKYYTSYYEEIKEKHLKIYYMWEELVEKIDELSLEIENKENLSEQ